VNSSSGSPEPERIENRIARAIGNTLEPYFSKVSEQISISTVGLMATNLVQRLGLDQHEAVSAAIQMLSEAEEGLAFLSKARAAYEREKKEFKEEEVLACDSGAKDDSDSFRQYLKKVDAPEYILSKGFAAHRNALLKHGIFFNDGQIEGRPIFSLRPHFADEYIKAEQAVRAEYKKQERERKKEDENA
jgi:hypothetical protein